MIELIVEVGALVFLLIIWRQLTELEKKLATLNEGEKIEQIREILEVED